MTSPGEIGTHVEGAAHAGSGRSMTNVVTCSCGASAVGDAYYHKSIRHAWWMNHVIGALLAEVAELRSLLHDGGKPVEVPDGQ